MIEEMLRKVKGEPAAAEGLSMHEWVKATGRNTTQMQRAIRLGMSEGRIALAHRVEVRIDGKRCRVPVYAVVKGKRNG